MSSQINESVIRDVIQEVLGRLGSDGNLAASGASTAAPSVASTSSGSYAPPSCGCNANRSGHSGRHGVFATAAEACDAAQQGFLQLQKEGIVARRKVEEIVKTMCADRATEWGRIELEESKIGRLDHKIEKLQIIKLVPGVDWIRPDARSGDHGITLE